jgi:hypothetical protein
MSPRRLALVGVVALGCAGGRARTSDGNAGADGDAAGPETTDAGADLAVADAVEGDAGDAAPKPLPVAAPASRRVVDGQAALLGHGSDSCTNGVGATGDRWCAFARSAGELFELWVIDATSAVAGPVACDGTDGRCLRISKRLYKNRANAFADAGFNGDTLIYGETPYPGDSMGAFVGVLWAWRPGWTAGRALTSDLGVYCVGQARSDAVMCFENRVGNGLDRPLTIELHAGRLSSGAGALLPLVDRLVLALPIDAIGAPARCQFELSPDGAYVAWSTRSETDALETLRVSALGDQAAPLVVARDVSRWAMSPDGRAWYWLARYNYDVTGAPAGTLQTAPFPGGANPTTLAPAVGDFAVTGARSLWFRADLAAEVGTLRLLADRAAPEAAATLDTGVRAVLDDAPDGARLLYSKAFTPVRPGPITTTIPGFNLVDLYARSATGAETCVVVSPPAAVQGALSPSGSLALWERYDVATGERQGIATTLASCASTPFATRLGALLPAGDAAYVYADEVDEAASEATLRYARVVNGALSPVAQIQTRAAPVFAPLAPALPAVMYTVATGTSADGLYAYVDPAPPDAGGGS